jgi:hypothetical protein
MVVRQQHGRMVAMSTVGQPNPFELLINGEPATDTAISTMERLAGALLQPLPAEQHRHFGFESQGGAIILFSTYLYEEDETGYEHARVSLASGNYANILFSLDFGPDNQPSSVFCPHAKSLTDAAKITQDLLGFDELEPEAAAVTQHIQSLVFCLSGLIGPEQLGPAATEEEEQEIRLLGDVVRKMVKQKTSCMVRIKEYGLPLDDTCSLVITEHQLVGTPGIHDSKEEIPKLRIVYEDYLNDIIYCYDREQNGTVRLNTSSVADKHAAAQDKHMDPHELAVKGFRTQLGMDRPGKDDVELITDKLLEASVVDSTTFGDIAN